MAFVVENGNGIEDARSYASVQQWKDFASLRVGVAVPADDADIQKALVTASEWIDSNFAQSFIGSRAFPKQAMEFPRTGFVDTSGYAIPNAMPPQLIKAVCILACEAVKGDALYKNADGAARQLTEDTIGPITKKYAANNPNAMVVERQFPEVRQTISPLLRSLGMLRVDR